MEINDKDVCEFVDQIDEPRKKDILKLIELGQKVTHKAPKLWGSIIGFERLKYTYQTGRTGEMPAFGLANRKQAITLYMSYNIGKYDELKDLGKHKIGKGCLYIKKLEDINLEVLETLIHKAIDDLLNSQQITDLSNI